MNRPIPPLTRSWMWRAGQDMTARDWLDFAIVIAFVIFVAWSAGVFVK